LGERSIDIFQKSEMFSRTLSIFERFYYDGDKPGGKEKEVNISDGKNLIHN
jgi:hypothetical protein